MKIVYDEKIPFLGERLAGAKRSVEAVRLPAAEITREAVKDVDALIVRTRTACDASLLSGSRVKMVATATIGMDHIDSRWCAENGIAVVNAPGCNAPGVMQYVACSLHAAGFDPARHTLGVVGKGNIGSLVTDLYRRAGGNVIVSDPPRKEAGHGDEEYLPIEELMRRADAITFHVPLDATTRGLLNENSLRNTKEGAIIVNASRGGVMTPEALANKDKRITWIIDTWPFEERGELRGESLEGEMIEIPFISTPHIAGYSEEGKQRATLTVIEALNDAFSLGIPTEGLTGYEFRKKGYRLADVIASYNPLADSERLKSAPTTFETLRNAYRLRPEPKPI